MFQKYLTKTRNKGFTLIEMIVVIAIIAVLIALVAPLMTKYIATARQAKADGAAKSLYTAAEAVIAEETLNGTTSFVESDVASDALGYIDNNSAITSKSVTISDGAVAKAEVTMDDGASGAYPLS